MLVNKLFVKEGVLTLTIFLICYGSALVQESNEVQVTRWNNESISGTFDGFTKQGDGVLIDTGGKTQTLQISELLKLEFNVTGFNPTPTAIFLRGGGELWGEIMKEGKDGSVFLNAPVLKESRNVSLTWVDRVEFTERTKQTDESVKSKQNDVLYQVNGDRFKGFLSKISPTSIQFEDRNLGAKTFALEDVLQVDLASVGAKPSPPGRPYLEVHGVGGSILQGVPVSSENSTLILSGFLEDVKWTIDLNKVRSILIKNGKTTYLSDIDPVEVVQKQVFPWQPNPDDSPNLQERYQWRRDQAVPDHPGRTEPIMMNGTVYEKGIGCTPYTKLTYALEEEFRTFEATIGLDDQSQHPEYDGAVEFRVYVDGEQQFSSGTIRKSMPPEQISVDVSGASRMSLEVAMKTGYLDFADWADARLIRDE